MLKHFVFIILSSLGTLSAAYADSWLAWSEFDEKGENIQIYLSREAEDKVGPVHQITHRGMNITPSLLATEKTLWIAWVDRANRLEYRLRYARIDTQTQNLLESGTIATSDRKVYAPVLAQTASGLPAVAWSGLDDKDEEIRFAYFQAGRWGAEQRITQNNEPDTLPLFSTGQKGELLLSWERISDNEISIHSITLHSDFVTARTEKSAGGQPDNSTLSSHRQAARNDAAIQRLPASLQARQNQFLIGSRATAFQ